MSECGDVQVDMGAYMDGSGYWMDYNLTTEGATNDLTLQCSFMKVEQEKYSTILEDLHVL